MNNCSTVNITNTTGNSIAVTSENNLITITDNNRCNSVTIPQQVTSIIQVNALGPQGPQGPQGDSVFVNTGSGSYSASGSFFITGSLTVSSSNTFTNIGPAIFSGSVTGVNGFTGSLEGTASYATTASYVIGGGGGSGAGFPYSGSAVITGSLLVSGSGLTVVGNQIMSGSIIFNEGARITSTYYGNSYPGYIDIVAGAPGGFVELLSYNSQSSFYVDDDGVSLLTSASYLWTFDNSGSFNTPGDVTIAKNLYVQGTASIQEIQFISQSVLNIGTNLITVNTATPSVRFGGLAVYDSGSTGTGLTGSLLWDSENNVWIYSNPSGSSYDGALMLVGPRNSTGIGNEVGINSWYAAIGNGSHHMTSSQIWNSGSIIRLETDTQVTGSLTVNGVGVSVIKERRQDFVYPYSYCGTAASGSAEAASVWTIVRINMSGSTDTIGTATNVAWTNRYSATYI
jgi:hypothetical protein